MPRRFLKHLPQRLVTSLDEEVACYSRWWLAGRKHSKSTAEHDRQALLAALRFRWRFDDSDLTEDVQHDLAGGAAPSEPGDLILPVALTLHRYGWPVPDLIDDADRILHRLAASDLLPSSFDRLVPKLRATLEAPPKPLNRKPPQKPNVTQYRKGDLLSVRCPDGFRAAYVHETAHSGGSTCPVLSFFDFLSPQAPTVADLHEVPAKGERLNDGQDHSVRFGVFGLNYLPDPPSQITVIAASCDTAPSEEHLEERIGLWTVERLVNLGTTIGGLFGNQQPLAAPDP